jgi:hypothetical protein
MLFTDGPLSTVEHLAEYEVEVRQVGASEGINLDAKLLLAQTEMGMELQASYPDLALEQVVVTTPLRHWHIFHTLAIVYRDAFNRRRNDKYQPKWTEYQELAKTAAGQYRSIGIGIVRNPLPAPAAPSLAGIAGGALPATIYVVHAAWVNAAGQESGPSQATSISLPGGQLLVITPPAAPSQAVGWFPYVGEQRQASGALAVAEPWTMPAGGPVAGPALPEGQAPDFFRPQPHTLHRG